MDSLDKIVPQAPQPDFEPDQSINPEAAIEAPEDREDYDNVSMAFTDDEPARDVGGEVGRKTPRWNGWQIAGIVAGGLAVAAGIAAAVYVRSRQGRPGELSHSDKIKSGLGRSGNAFDKAPLVKSAREKVSAFFS